MPYTYQTFGQVKTLLASRLYNPAKTFWSDVELGIYIAECLRTWNALTAHWVTEFQFTYMGTSSGTAWLNISQIPGTPRPYTRLNTDVYSVILYHLLEPQIAADGITWNGTEQFSLTDIVGALERRQNELIMQCGLNVTRPVPAVLAPDQRDLTLPDTYLDIRRVKYVPFTSPTNFGPAQVLWRGDLQSFQYFSSGYLQQRQNPRNYALSDVPPLELEVDFPPPQPGTLDMLVNQSQSIPTPPSAQILVVPDDWVWVLKWGVLMDLLYRQSEAQDNPRAKYCKTRYIEGMQLLAQSPWVLNASIENVPVDIESVMERDQYNPGWEYDSHTRQGIITAGLDTFAVAPLAGLHPTSSVILNLIENAPIPVADTDFVQVSRDVLDVLLDYGVHIAMFKCGGSEFQETIQLFDNFRKSAQAENKRIAGLGLYDDVVKSQGRRQELVDAR